jgi:hypothetical protein
LCGGTLTSRLPVSRFLPSAWRAGATGEQLASGHGRVSTDKRRNSQRVQALDLNDAMSDGGLLYWLQYCRPVVHRTSGGAALCRCLAAEGARASGCWRCWWSFYQRRRTHTKWPRSMDKWEEEEQGPGNGGETMKEAAEEGRGGLSCVKMPLRSAGQPRRTSQEPLVCGGGEGAGGVCSSSHVVVLAVAFWS